jgi:uncharacterized membrane protein
MFRGVGRLQQPDAQQQNVLNGGDTGIGQSSRPHPARLVTLDLARTAALSAMVVYHFVFDLALFGVIDPGIIRSGFWRGFAIATAASFIFIAGFSLWLSHGSGLRWHAFWRRLLKITAAAALVTVATYQVFPERFVFFGILHSIAMSSLVGLLFLRSPVWLILGVALAVFAVSEIWNIRPFDAAWLQWTGLTLTWRPSVDFEPFFPWFAPFLLGLACAKQFSPTRMPQGSPGTGFAALAWVGRHTLILYLVHQPILIGLVWTFVQLSGQVSAG